MALSETKAMNPLNPNSLVGENFQFTLDKSVRDLLADIRDGGSNFLRFVDVFYSLMQAKIDPPFESIWIYAALSFRSQKSINEDPWNRVTSAKNLLQFISACSGPYCPSKSIGLLAPLVFEVHELVTLLLGNDSSSKKGKKAMREAKSLIDAMLGYLSLCSGNNSDNETAEHVDLRLRIAVPDLVRVWTDSDAGLDSFFPLVSSDIRKKMIEEDFDVNSLAGVVLVEAFFLKLLLDFRGAVIGDDSEKELRNWVVGSITGFCNSHFFYILANMLMEPKLPLETHLLSSEHGNLLRRILYDAVVLVDYSFLNINTSTNLDIDLAKSLALSRLIVTAEAIEFCRKNKDQKRALSYSNAFLTSRLRLQIMKWIKMVGGADSETRSSPKDLIMNLITNLDKQGAISIGDSLLKRCVNLTIDDSQRDYFEHISTHTKENKAAADLLFYVDNKGEEREDNESVESDEDKETDEITNAALINAARSMKVTEKGGKKRKERGNAGEKGSIKYFKYDLSVSGSAGSGVTSAASNDDSSSESDLED